MGDYILIDRDQMKITHKHPDRVVLTSLSWIECTNSGVIISLSNTRPLLDFTPAELSLIYKHATGTELKGYAQQLANSVLAAAKRMPDTVAKLDEVVAQSRCIQDGDKSCYRYVIGSKTPEQLPTVFQAPALSVPRSEAEEQAAESGYAGPAFGGTGHANTPAGTNPLPHAARAPSAPRTGAITEKVFTIADQLWEAAGKPKSLQVVLQLRKKIMDVLETEHDVKRTTASNTLAVWQKTRLA